MDPVVLNIAVVAAFSAALVLSLNLLQRYSGRVRPRGIGPLRWTSLGFAPSPGGYQQVRDGFGVTVEKIDAGTPLGVRISVHGIGRQMSPRAALARKGGGGGPDLVTGDRAFDETVSVRGAPDIAAALLDAKTRDLVLPLVKNHELRVEQGRIVLETSMAVDSPAFPGLIGRALELAGRLVLRDALVPERLGEVARTDPNIAVRLRAVALLAEQLPGCLEARRTLQSLLDDRHPEVRLRAALSLGEEGHGALEDLVASAVGARQHGGDLAGAVPSDLELAAARALDALVAALPRGSALPIVRNALGAPTGPLLLSALEAAGSLGDASSEIPAILALDVEADDLRLAAVRTLGAIGTVAAVPPLRALTDGKPFALALRGAVAEAVARIQGRLPGAEAGQVALGPAGEAEGRVSIFEPDRAGRVSLPARDNGQRN